MRVLINAQHDGVLGRREVEADDIAHLGDEAAIGDSLKVSSRCGCRPKARQIRCTLEVESPLALALPREDQWVASLGALSSVLTITASMRILDRPRRSRAGRIVKPVQPMLNETLAPLADRAFVDLNWFRPHASIGIRCLSADSAYPRITR